MNILTKREKPLILLERNKKAIISIIYLSGGRGVRERLK